MPRRGQRQPQGSVPVVTPNEDCLDRLGVREVRSHGRRAASHRVNPANYECAVLAGQLADEWIAYARRFALRKPEVFGQAVRDFAKFVDRFVTEHGGDPAQARLDSAAIDLANVFHEWEVYTKQQYASTSEMPYTLSSCVRNLIAERGQRDPAMPGKLRAKANAPSLYGKPKSNALDEFSNAERLTMRETARGDVRELEARLRRGTQLLEQGVDPRTTPDGWLEVPNLVWAARHGVLTSEPLKSRLGGSASRSWPAPLRQLIARFPRSGVDTLMRAAAGLLFPSEADLNCFRILLLMEADCSPEELIDMNLEDVEFTDGGVRLVQTKMRAHRIRARQHVEWDVDDTNNSAGEHRTGLEFHGAGQWDVPGLLRRLLAVTETTRAAYPGHPWLWLAVENNRNRSTVNACRAKFDRETGRFSYWITSHKVGDEPMVISQPHDLRRLRKTVKTSRVVALGGNLSDLAGDDHTIEVFQGHY
ncbi:MAG TPA: hypothetical protein VGN81_26155, partial [Pseudonocardiaceae bacterium]